MCQPVSIHFDEVHYRELVDAMLDHINGHIIDPTRVFVCHDGNLRVFADAVEFYANTIPPMPIALRGTQEHPIEIDENGNDAWEPFVLPSPDSVAIDYLDATRHGDDDDILFADNDIREALIELCDNDATDEDLWQFIQDDATASTAPVDDDSVNSCVIFWDDDDCEFVCYNQHIMHDCRFE